MILRFWKQDHKKNLQHWDVVSIVTRALRQKPHTYYPELKCFSSEYPPSKWDMRDCRTVKIALNWFAAAGKNSGFHRFTSSPMSLCWNLVSETVLSRPFQYNPQQTFKHLCSMVEKKTSNDRKVLGQIHMMLECFNSTGPSGGGFLDFLRKKSQDSQSSNFE